ncbi:ABC transporter substrate-binding protein [Noviherbaspirillum sp. 17J57-3]|uniref:ABC transporter substrate-binding protein n=1 Tax=Noviherbaspirillum galbum TaxID=2709383 RepID=A0A6B3SFF4_9BURK|nr:ABC transporter substrate-binding protein [Noviherbaspirillum galbum]
MLIGLDGEYDLDNSISAEAVELGLKVAIAEINAAGGVLGGRKIQLVTRGHRSMPARGIKNIQEFARMPDLVAVFGGRFSPVIIEELPTLKDANVPFMAVWSSADMIIDNGMSPNFAFRLSLRDSLAMPKMLSVARKRGIERVGLLLTNTSWGRSNLAAANQYEQNSRLPRIVHSTWYNWRDASLLDKYQSLRAKGAQAIILVANDDEAATLVKEMATLPATQRVPILSHWGITGGEFAKQAGPALQAVDLSVIQTFSFFQASKEKVDHFLRQAAKVSDVRKIEDIKGPVGVAHAYDMMHILARAIAIAGSTDRAKVRDAMERVSEYQGLVRHYKPPFSPARHEALGPEQLIMARYRADGVLVPSKD